MGVGDMAEYCVDRGMGRYITYEEALEILKRAEDHGFVHQVTNIDGEDKIGKVATYAIKRMLKIANPFKSEKKTQTPSENAPVQK